MATQPKKHFKLNNLAIITRIPGVLFLSGGLSEDEATLNLNQINTLEGRKPWTLTFSFGRAMHNSVLAVWKGVDDNKPNAQCVLMRLARVSQWSRYHETHTSHPKTEIKLGQA